MGASSAAPAFAIWPRKGCPILCVGYSARCRGERTDLTVFFAALDRDCIGRRGVRQVQYALRHAAGSGYVYQVHRRGPCEERTLLEYTSCSRGESIVNPVLWRAPVVYWQYTATMAGNRQVLTYSLTRPVFFRGEGVRYGYPSMQALVVYWQYTATMAGKGKVLTYNLSWPVLFPE